jgi:hypothetical protein
VEVKTNTPDGNRTIAASTMITMSRPAIRRGLRERADRLLPVESYCGLKT